MGTNIDNKIKSYKNLSFQDIDGIIHVGETYTYKEICELLGIKYYGGQKIQKDRQLTFIYNNLFEYEKINNVMYRYGAYKVKKILHDTIDSTSTVLNSLSDADSCGEGYGDGGIDKIEKIKIEIASKYNDDNYIEMFRNMGVDIKRCEYNGDDFDIKYLKSVFSAGEVLELNDIFQRLNLENKHDQRFTVRLIDNLSRYIKFKKINKRGRYEVLGFYDFPLPQKARCMRSKKEVNRLIQKNILTELYNHYLDSGFIYCIYDNTHKLMGDICFSEEEVSFKSDDYFENLIKKIVRKIDVTMVQIDPKRFFLDSSSQIARDRFRYYKKFVIKKLFDNLYVMASKHIINYGYIYYIEYNGGTRIANLEDIKKINKVNEELMNEYGIKSLPFFLYASNEVRRINYYKKLESEYSRRFDWNKVDRRFVIMFGDKFLDSMIETDLEKFALNKQRLQECILEEVSETYNINELEDFAWIFDMFDGQKIEEFNM